MGNAIRVVCLRRTTVCERARTVPRSLSHALPRIGLFAGRRDAFERVFVRTLIGFYRRILLFWRSLTRSPLAHSHLGMSGQHHECNRYNRYEDAHFFNPLDLALTLILCAASVSKLWKDAISPRRRAQMNVTCWPFQAQQTSQIDQVNVIELTPRAPAPLTAGRAPRTLAPPETASLLPAPRSRRRRAAPG